eukprot:TRINITY_DN2031_c0_g3_i1.p1 TRINITY_DN2031_c0_g3~~TRINITY_DN2031_c0_g3_i1.p1  ORF type:complete len:162 (-),score=4.02 TRINITY_DN2031_c0_g3_i1:662-1147(-)
MDEVRGQLIPGRGALRAQETGSPSRDKLSNPTFLRLPPSPGSGIGAGRVSPSSSFSRDFRGHPLLANSRSSPYVVPLREHPNNNQARLVEQAGAASERGLRGLSVDAVVYSSSSSRWPAWHASIVANHQHQQQRTCRTCAYTLATGSTCRVSTTVCVSECV